MLIWHKGGIITDAMSGLLQLQLLGDCQIIYNGVPVTSLTLTKARALLSYLAVTNRSHPRAHIVDLLWTELPESDARRNLRVVLTKLRQAIGDQLETSQTHVGLRVGAPRQVDVLTFVKAAEQIGAYQALPLSPPMVDTLTTAFALYQHEFLNGLEPSHAPGFEEWMLLERERLRQLAFQIGERLAEHHETMAAYTVGINICRRLLTLEPWQEAVHRRLMTLLVKSGQQTTALQQYEQCRRLLAEELALEPEAATQELYARIRQAKGIDRDLALETLRGQSNTDRPQSLRTQIPLPTTPFLGRNAEIHQVVAHLIDPACRLLTIIGPGGIGKTRLAEEVTHQLAGQAEAQATISALECFRDGIFFVAASSLPTFDDLVATVMTALALRFAGQEPPEQALLHYLATEKLLLVIDNFEHLVTDADRLHHWLQHAPGLTLLVTSRERLNLSAEWLFPLQGLPLPALDATIDELATNDAIQLFVRRAQRVNLGFMLPVEPASKERAALIAICRLLEGMPLAIELAAGWTRTHSCTEILAEIRHNLDFLASELRDIPARHRSLRAAFDHSWRLLNNNDATVMQQLVLLPAGFRADLAQQITGATAPTLLRLVDKSLLQRSPEQRYIIHELLRQYVVQQLTLAERDAILGRYARAYMPWVAKQYAARESADETEALNAVGAEFANLRLIWQWLLAQSTQHDQSASNRQGDKQRDEQRAEEALLETLHTLLPMLAYYYIRRSRYQEGKRYFTDTLTTIEAAQWQPKGDRPARKNEAIAEMKRLFWARLIVALADMRFHLSEFAAVVTEVEQALPVFKRQEEKANEANANAANANVAKANEAEALVILGKTWVRMGRYTEAEGALQQSLVWYQRGTERTARKERMVVLNALGILYSNQGHFARAAHYYEEYLAIAREQKYQRGIANALNNLGSNYARDGEHRRALPLYRETYLLAEQVGERLMLAVALSNLGSVSRSLNNYEDAKRYYEQSLVHCRAMGERRWTAAGLNGLGLVLLGQGEQGAAATHFKEAVTIAELIASAPDLLDALAGLGTIALFEPSTAAVDVASLLTFVAEHPVTQTYARQQSRDGLIQLTATLSPSELQEATQQATMLDLSSAAVLACSLA